MNAPIPERPRNPPTTVLIEEHLLLNDPASAHPDWISSPYWLSLPRAAFPYNFGFTGTVSVFPPLAQDLLTSRATPLGSAATHHIDVESDIYLPKSPVSTKHVFVSFVYAGRSSRRLLGGDETETD